MTDTPRTLEQMKTAHVVARFVLRIIVLCAFAALSGAGFSQTLTVLLLLSTVFCILMAIFRQEKPLQSSFTHWDEAAVYGLLYGLMLTVNQAASP